MRLVTWLALLLLLLSLPAEAARRGRSRSSRGQGVDLLASNVGVSLGLYGGSLLVDDFQVVRAEESLYFFGGWIGGTFHPRPGRISPFLALGTEIAAVVPPGNGPDGRGSAAVEVVPSVRFGVSAPSDDAGHWFPDLEVYALGGFRIPNHIRGSAIRLGAGISIPAFARAQYKWIKIPFIPWMFDIFYDYSPRHELGFRVGYHF
ncbi:MAG TPA: hypothetical protein VNA24_36840 [Hyalangium sp.]|nr:hypothetical protein [Hyalangium sp.]